MSSIANSGVPNSAHARVTKRRGVLRGRRPYHRRRFDHGEPISKPNHCLTVGIWVCLAGMILWTVRPQTHALLIDLPLPGVVPLAESIDYQRIVVGVDVDGTVRWDGEAISLEELAAFSSQTRDQAVKPLVVLRPDPMASYWDALKALAVIQQSGVTFFCFGGLQDNADALAIDHGAPLHALLAITPGPMPPHESECEWSDELPPPRWLATP